MAEDRNRSSSLRRALDVLSAIALECERGSSPTLTELSEYSGVNRSTVSRLLQPLLEAGFVEQDVRSGRYRLGPQTARLGQIYLENFEAHDVAGPILRALAEESLETAHIGVQDGVDIVYVDKYESPLSVRTVSRIGSRQPLYCTAIGKTLLAFAGESALTTMLESGMPARTVHTITEAGTLRSELDEIRARGYAVDDEENEAGIRCVGAPVFNHRGEVVAAISISGPANRMTIDRIGLLSGTVRNAAIEISRRLAAPEEALRALSA
jgi:DNA-binding IclR family transcriptional regulator